MTDNETFERIPLSYDYSFLKKLFFRHCNEMMIPEPPCTPIQAVCGAFHYHYDVMIEDNGMDRVAVMVLGFLFEMEHDNIDPDLAFAVNWHIEDFEKGDYESLFNKDDLKQLQADILKVKEYLKEYFEKHP